jgi:glycosyltransferase involved in cell wall biosynthesis
METGDNINPNLMSILIPSKDEPNIQETVAEIEKLFPQAEIIVCNDRYGNGKGWAIRQAVLHCKGDIICFIDGDMDIHPRMIFRLIPFLKDYDIVLGRKQIRKRLSRRILTILSRIYIRFLFGLPYDTQTGIKLFKKSVIPYWSSNSFSFDVEIIGLAHKNKVSIIEVPVEVTDRGKSAKAVKLSNVLKALLESFKIWINLL